MKKQTLLLFLTLAFMGIATMSAQVVTTWESSLTPVTKDALVASAGTGAKYAFRMPSISRPGWCDFVNLPPYYTEENHHYDLTSSYLFTINAGFEDGKYWLTRYTDGQSLSGNHAFADTGMDLTLTDRAPSDVSDFDTGFSDSTPYVSFDNASGGHYNCGNGSGGLQFRGGTGGWSVYAIYGPFYVVRIVAVDGASNPLYEKEVICYDGTEVSAPELTGYAVSGSSTYTVDGADYVWNLVYEATAFVDYTVNITYENDVVVPVTVVVKGTDVTSSLTYHSEGILTAENVVATVTEPAYYATTVTISGDVINVYCYDARWPINFPKTQTYTRSDRHLDGITFESSVVGNQSATGFYNNGMSTLCYQDLTNDAERTITFPAETEVHPNIARTGGWEHGFVYIDLDNNGSFADEGELVSKVNEGNPSLSKDMPNFIMPSTPGTYRMRVKMDWASEDPGGNPGPSNYIIDNGGAIVDLSLVITAPVTTTTVTYKVVDESGSDIWTSDPVTVVVGETISTLPDAMKRAYTSYTDGDPITTVEDASQNVFTTTATFNLPFKSFTSFEDAAWYKATLRSSYYVKYDADTEPYIPVTTYEDADNFMWAFQGNPYTGIAVYNKATGEGKTLTTDENGTWNSATKPIAVMRDGVNRWEIKVSGYSENGFVLLDPNRANYYVNQNGTAYLGFWVNSAAINDNGSTWRLEEILSAHDQLVVDLTAAIAALNSKNFGSDYGQFGFTGEYAGYKGMENVLIPGAISEAQSALDADDEAQMATKLATLQEILANLALNVPVNGSAFRIKSTHDTYVTNVAAIKSGTSYRNTLTDDVTDPNTIMFYADGKIYCYGTGTEMLGSGSTYYVSVQSWEFLESTVTPGKYAVRYTATGNDDKQETRYLFAWGPDSSYPNSMDHNSTDAANCVFSLEAVTEIPVEVGEMQYTTLYLPVGVQAVEGLTLNTVSLKGEDQLSLESVESIEPRTAVVVNAPVPGVYNLPVVKNGVQVDENILTGVAFGGETLADDVNAYVLNEDELGAGFFLWNEDTRVMKSWKAYFVPGSEPTVQAYRFTEATGLNKAGLQRGNDSEVFDLQGRRVEKAQKGLYIVNGQKVLVK